jgi:hypothetical protein
MQITRIAALVTLIVFMLLNPSAQSSSYDRQMIDHPERYIKISDWTIYSTWSAVAIIHHVTIENTGDIPYKDVMVRVRYYQTSAPGAGTQIAQETGVLPVTLPPHSKDTYLKNGSTLGAASMSMYPKEIEVLGAVPILQ